MTASYSATRHARAGDTSPLLRLEIGDRLGERPAMTAGILRRVLPLAVRVVGRRTEYASTPQHRATVVQVDVLDAHHDRVRAARALRLSVHDDDGARADEQLRAMALRLPSLDEAERVAQPVDRLTDARVHEHRHHCTRRHRPIVHPVTNLRNSSSVTSPRLRAPSSFTLASSSARPSWGTSRPSSSALMRIESMPLFFPRTRPRSAPTSSDEYGSIEGGSWNCDATAPDSRRKSVSPVTGFHGSSSYPDNSRTRAETSRMRPRSRLDSTPYSARSASATSPRFALPARSPIPLMVPWIQVAPARTAAAALAVASPKSLWPWKCTGVPSSHWIIRPTRPCTASGAATPSVSTTATSRAPASTAAS